ncbi:hypothetical protein X975_14293, partial [Stegodyphus mimosarum]
MEDTSGSEESGEGNDASENYDSLHDKKQKNTDSSCKSKRSVKRKLKTFSFGKWQKGFNKEKAKKRTFSLNRDAWQSCSSVVSEASMENATCICTGYRKTKHPPSERTVAPEEETSSSKAPVCRRDAVSGSILAITTCPRTTPIESSRSTEDKRSSNGDNQQQAVEATNSNLFIACQSSQQPLAINEISITELTLALQAHMRFSIVPSPFVIRYGNVGYNVDNRNGFERRSCSLNVFSTAHTQIDYVHHLVPDLLEITNCSFYWGKMDRYKAEKQLDKKPEGTFLLRDSAQEEFLFSVSFRRYGRTLHARIEQLNHKFSFDSHDPNVFTSSTVCGLVEHYKNPRCCMFFEPMLTIP